MVEGGGFEPPKAELADLQSAPFNHSGTPPFHNNELSNIAQYCRRSKFHLCGCSIKYSSFLPSIIYMLGTITNVRIVATASP